MDKGELDPSMASDNPPLPGAPGAAPQGPEAQPPAELHASAHADELEQLLRRELGPDLEVVRRLGRGSVAYVYLAREEAL
jgi:hypothetical protein